ncbi:hypothetical protein SDC9_158063 [bioreactor metagenome]|uniref:Uncharacterized protein n=1 Tax=bioreactor metagenome TaxID=1076179 RepID=A0A645FAX9_9ZZZZ
MNYHRVSLTKFLQEKLMTKILILHGVMEPIFILKVYGMHHPVQILDIPGWSFRMGVNLILGVMFPGITPEL